MSDKQKYWYFRFTKEFILNNKLQNIKDAYPDGSKIVFIYMELCAIAIEDRGAFTIKNIGPVYFYDLIARRINETKEDVVRAIEILIQSDILTVEYTEIEGEISSTLTIPDMENKIGSSSRTADLQRIRDRHMKELGEWTEKEKDAYMYGVFKNVALTEHEYQELERQYLNPEEIINQVSFWVEKKKIDPTKIGAYAYCLDFAKEHGQARMSKEKIKEDRYGYINTLLENNMRISANDIAGLDRKELKELLAKRKKYKYKKALLELIEGGGNDEN